MLSSASYAPSSGGRSEARPSLHLESPNTSSNRRHQDVDIKNMHDVHLIPENALEVKVSSDSNSGSALAALKEHGDVIHEGRLSLVPAESSNLHEILSDHASTQYTSSPTSISPVSSTHASTHTPRTLDHVPQLSTPPVSITNMTSATATAGGQFTPLSASTASVLASSSVSNHVDSSPVNQSQVITSALYIKNPIYTSHSRGEANFPTISGTKPGVIERPMKETGKLLSDLLVSGHMENGNTTSSPSNKRHHPGGESFVASSEGDGNAFRIKLGDSRHTHNDLPLGLRNKRMKPTDCLLFAATLLSEDENRTAPGEPMKAKIAPDIQESSGFHSFSTRTSTISRQAGETYGSKETPTTETGTGAELSEPRDVDVLCGRGGLINKHPGNVVYRKVVDYNKPFYQSVHKKHRILVSQSIVQSILNFGGRFLILGSKMKSWTEIGYKKAVQKTSQALRERASANEEEAGEDESYVGPLEPYHVESDDREEEEQHEDCLSRPVNGRTTTGIKFGENQKNRNYMLEEEEEEGIYSETEVQAV